MLPIPLPLARHWRIESCRRDAEVLGPVRHPAVVLPPCHLTSVGVKVAPADMMMDAQLGPA